MVRLTRLRIDRFRNVRAGTDLRFGPTFNVLLGKNATGKSTLLDLIAAVTGDDLSAYAMEEEGFDLTWWLEEGEGQVEVHAARKPAKTQANLEQLGDEKEFDDAWTITVSSRGIEMNRVDVRGTRGVWKPAGAADQTFDVRAGLANRLASIRTLAEVNAKHPGAVDQAFVVRANPRGLPRFDEALSSFEAITRISFNTSRGSKHPTVSYGGWMPSALGTAILYLSRSEPIAISLTTLRTLSEIPALLGFASAEIRPRVLTTAVDRKRIITHYQGIDILFRRADDSQVSHELLSFGQKRLFAFLWYLAVEGTDNSCIVADELLNGLHHEWIDVCFERMRDRQSFLATQHPMLLDHIPIESAEAARTTFVRCTLDAGPDGREQMVWRNFTEEEAERFFTAYETGIQHVSEVLRSEGLW